MSTDEKKTCKNCSAEYTGSYCPHCGQAASVERFTVKGTLKELYLTFSVADNTFYHTSKSLICRPGHMVREYLIGERQRYLKPIRMLMVLVTVYVIITNLLIHGESLEDIYIRKEVGKLSFLGSSLTYIIALLQNKVYGSLVSALLCTIPFTWLFRKYKITFKEDGHQASLNLAEHFYTIVYISCQLMFITFLEIPLQLIFGYQLDINIGTLINILLYIICYKQLLGISWFKSMWKVLLGMLLVSILYLAILAVIFIIECIFNPSILTSLQH